MSTTVSSVSSAETTEASVGSGNGLSVDQETFLNLLVVQLQNQDPLEPMSNQEFVAQLAQFSSLEQLTSVNTSLDSLYLAMASMNNAAMTSLIGLQVVAVGNEFNYEGSGTIDLHYEAASNASQATLTITDASGAEVWSGSIGALEEGEGTYTWSGCDAYGNPVDAGTYTFTIEATDTSGNEVGVDTLIEGVVDSMSYDTGTPIPTIDGIQVSLGDILRVESATQP